MSTKMDGSQRNGQMCEKGMSYEVRRSEKMSKYTPLTEWLRRRHESSVELTFAEIERILNDELPPTSRQHFTSWDNRSGGIQDAWLNAGWKTVMVNLEEEKVKFQRK